MDKYIILDDLGDKYLVGFESGKIGYVTKEFERASAINFQSDWFAVFVEHAEAERIIFPKDDFGQIAYDIIQISGMGITFRGAYIPERKRWVYVERSYKKL